MHVVDLFGLSADHQNQCGWVDPSSWAGSDGAAGGTVCYVQAEHSQKSVEIVLENEVGLHVRLGYKRLGCKQGKENMEVLDFAEVEVVANTVVGMHCMRPSDTRNAGLEDSWALGRYLHHSHLHARNVGLFP